MTQVAGGLGGAPSGNTSTEFVVESDVLNFSAPDLRRPARAS